MVVPRRLVEWQRRYDLGVRFRPVYPIAIRTPEFFERMNPLWPRYFMTDVHRVAEFLGLPFRWPRPDPVVQEIKDGRPTTAPDQPYIHRLTRLGAIDLRFRGRIVFQPVAEKPHNLEGKTNA